MILKELLHELRGTEPLKSEDETINITHLEMDSRLVEQGTLFFLHQWLYCGRTRFCTTSDR